MEIENTENMLFGSVDEELVAPPKKVRSFEITADEAATHKIFCKRCGRVHLLLSCLNKIIN
jgi:hypothetical protein